MMPRKNNHLLFAACDVKYFLKHAKAFVISAHEHGIDSFVLVAMNHANTEEQQKVFALANDLGGYTKHRFMYIYSEMPKVDDPRVYFATLRFMKLRNILDIANNIGYDTVWVSDIDAIIMRPITDYKFVSQYDEVGQLADTGGKDMWGTIGVYLRESKNNAGANKFETDGMQVAAGLVIIPTNLKDSFVKTFIDTLQTEIKAGPQKWFIDQIALHRAYQRSRVMSSGICYDLAGRGLLDWEFKDDTYIWTGKGPRKDHNKTYLTMKEKYDRMKINE